jgi:hypothetical protein
MPLLNFGFDWRAISSTGVSHHQVPESKELRITMNGQEPESVVLLRQILRLRPERGYRMQWEARTSGIPSGLSWRIGETTAPLQAANDWASGEAEFSAASAFPPLELQYHRPLGLPRAEGIVELRNIRVSEVAK